MKQKLQRASREVLNQAKRFSRFIFAAVLASSTLPAFAADYTDVEIVAVFNGNGAGDIPALETVVVKDGSGAVLTSDTADVVIDWSTCTAPADKNVMTDNTSSNVLITSVSGHSAAVGVVTIKVTIKKFVLHIASGIGATLPPKVYTAAATTNVAAEKPTASGVVFAEQAIVDDWGAGKPVFNTVGQLTYVAPTGAPAGFPVRDDYSVNVAWSLTPGSTPANFTLTPYAHPAPGKIVKRPIAVDGTKLTVRDGGTKVYDGTDTVRLVGVIDATGTEAIKTSTTAANGTNTVIHPAGTVPDATLAIEAFGILSDDAVGSRGVSLYSFALTGSAAGNYSIINPSSISTTGLTANITKRPVYVGGIKVENKPYDGTNLVHPPYISGTPFIASVQGTLNPLDADPVAAAHSSVRFVSDSPVTSAVFNSANVGNGQAITLTPSNAYALIGSGNSNYDLIQPALKADIVTAAITLTVTPIGNQTYTGSAIEPIASGSTTAVIHPASGAAVLTEGTDYDVSYSANNTNVGTATVTIVGIGDYAGSTGTTTFDIIPKNIGVGGLAQKAAIVNILAQTYDGTAKKPTLTVNAPTSPATYPPMVLGRDYVAYYSDSINVGTNTAKAKIVGIGNYTGEVEKTFTINKGSLSQSSTIVSYIVEGGEHLSIDLDALLPTDTFPGTYGGVRYGATFDEVAGSDILNGALSPVSSGFADSTVTSPMLVDITPIVSGTSATITVKATSANYNDFTINIPVSVAAAGQRPANISGVTMNGGVYNGNPYTGTAPIFTANDGTPIPDVGYRYDYLMSDGAAIATPKDPNGAPIYAGNYKLKITAPTGYVGSRDFPFSITKKPLTVTIKDVTLNQGDALPTDIGRTYVSLDGDYTAAAVTYAGFVNPGDTIALDARAKAQFTVADASATGITDISFNQNPSLTTTGMGLNYTILPANLKKGKLYVNKYVAPVAPTTVVATPGDGQASVSFDAPTDDGIGDHNGVTTAVNDITSYKVTSTPDGFTAVGTTSPIIITGLTNDVPYTFTVVARNAVGWGPASGSSASVTPVAVPPVSTAPSQISVVMATAGVEEATVAFAPPASFGTSGLDYLDYYTVTCVQDNTKSVTGTATTVTITGLTAGTDYTFEVTATNTEGLTSVPAVSNPVTPTPTVAPPTPPTPPATPTVAFVRVTEGVENATVEFTTSNAGKTPTDCMVMSTPDNKVATGTVATGTATSITVEGLTPGTSYTFKVMVNFADAPSIVSDASRAVKPLAPPANPTAPTIIDVEPGDGQVTVTFTPHNDGKTPTKYTVVSDPENISQEGAGSPITVTGLTNGETYTFTVTVTFADGTTPPLTSDASPSATPEDPTVPVDPSDINDVEKVAAMKLYPNPATENVTITGLQGNETIRFYDANGRAVLTRKATNSVEVIPVSHLQKGVYIVRVGTKALKIVKI